MSIIQIFNKTHFKLLYLFFSLSTTIMAQGDAANGMKFEHLPSMQSLFAKAKKENKLLFIDCYTTWCGPCKMMVSKVFNQKEVGDFYNAHFVNAKIQLDSTDEDSEYVKNWLKEGAVVAKEYQVNVYPTYLIFNGDGQIVHRFSGYMSPSKFIKAGKNILNPDSQYYSLIRRFEAGEKSPEFLLNLIKLTKSTYDPLVKKVTKTYLDEQKSIYTKENLKLLYDIVNTSTDYGFDIALKDGKKIDKILEEPGRSIRLTSGVILIEEMQPLLDNNNVSFDVYETKFKTKYPKHAETFLNNLKMFYYRRIENWDLFVRSTDKLVKVENLLTPMDINEAVWALVGKTSDPKLLETAIGWSKFILSKEPKNLNYHHAYVYLLDKAGKKTEAIAQTKKAIELAKGNKMEEDRFENFLKKINP